MKTILLLLIVCVGSTTSLLAQLFESAIPLTTSSTDAKTISLAYATVSASGTLGNYNINPAGIGVENTLQISVRNREFARGAKLTSFDGNSRVGNSAIALSYRKLYTGELASVGLEHPEFINSGHSEEIYWTANYAYAFPIGINIGAGINFNISDKHQYPSQPEKPELQKVFSFDFGLQYESTIFENEEIRLKPSFGLSLSDFGKGIYYNQGDRKSHLPTLLRVGSGIQFLTKEKVFNKSLVKMNLWAGLSKYMTRNETTVDTDGNSTLAPMNPFKALFKSWDSYSWRKTGSLEPDILKLNEQIWLQTGVELTILEKLSLRFGFEKAEKRDDFLNKVTFGAGINFNYFHIDYAKLTYNNSSFSNSYEELHHLQFTCRIPIGRN